VSKSVSTISMFIVACQKLD